MTEETKECPICHEVKPIRRDFGLRLKPEGFRPNSWCRKCRATDKIKSQIEREGVNWLKDKLVNPPARPRQIGLSKRAQELKDQGVYISTMDNYSTEELKNFINVPPVFTGPIECDSPVSYSTTEVIVESTARGAVDHLTWQKEQKDAERDYLRNLYHERRPNDKAWAVRSINFIRKRLGLEAWYTQTGDRK